MSRAGSRGSEPYLLTIVAGLLLALAGIVPQDAISAQKPNNTKVTAQYSQSAEEQQKDLSECYEIAKARTGINPSALNGAAPAKPPNAKETQSSDTSKASSPAETAAGTAQNVPPEADSAASAAADHSASNARKEEPVDTFRKANEACLRARGYIVNSNKTTSKEQSLSPEKP
jgi:hypothetical protein